MTNVIYLSPMDAPASENQLVYLLSHKSREAAKASWTAFAERSRVEEGGVGIAGQRPHRRQGGLGVPHRHRLLAVEVARAPRVLTAKIARRCTRISSRPRAVWPSPSPTATSVCCGPARSARRIGTWMQKVAQAWLIVTLTGTASAFFLGLDSFMGELPILLLTLVGGVVADRKDRRQLLLMSQYTQMAPAFVLAALVYFDVVRVWHVLALSAITGVAQAFGGPAYQSLIPSLVSKEHLPNAIALNSIQFNLARIIGPLIAGAALAAFGMVACFGLNGVSFLFVIAALLALQVKHIPPAASQRMIDEMKGGLRYVQGRAARWWRSPCSASSPPSSACRCSPSCRSSSRTSSSRTSASTRG